MKELIFQGVKYEIEEGSIIRIHDPKNIYGEWLKIMTDEFSTECIFIKREGAVSLFKVIAIDPIISDNITAGVLDVTEDTKAANKPLKSMLKSELIDYATSLGLDVKSSMSKTQIIEMIESHN